MITVGAPRGLEPVLTELVAQFRRQGTGEIQVRYDAAGRLVDAVIDGQAVDVLLLAGERHPNRLGEEDLLARDAIPIAEARLALYVPYGAPLRADDGLEGVAAAVRGNRLGRFVIPNPARSAYGAAARAGLQEAGLWSLLRSHLSLADDAAQAARFASGGSAQAGIIPVYLARTEPLARRGRWEPIATGLPVRYSVVLVAGHVPDARGFLAFLQSPEGQEVLERQGLTTYTQE